MWYIRLGAVFFTISHYLLEFFGINKSIHSTIIVVGWFLRSSLVAGRDGLTHNMLDNIHSHWKRKRVCKIKCKGVCTVDMANVHQQLEVRDLKYYSVLFIIHSFEFLVFSIPWCIYVLFHYHIWVTWTERRKLELL